MWALLLEVFGVGLILVFIVWWTMFSGNKPRPPEQQHKPEVSDKNHTDTDNEKLK